MSDIALVNGDIVGSIFGDVLVINDDDDIIQMAINNIKLIYGANEFHPNMGNTVYGSRYKMSENGLEEIATKCKNAIMQDYRVSNVIEVIAKNISTSQSYGLCDISFVLVTIYGTQLNSNITIQV